ncbi:hypothetical protein OG21DRAFT_1484405 [Imleria badia]|nr:hypothetical protein OG21DRAFT_1484405 [Imleria badia]
MSSQLVPPSFEQEVQVWITLMTQLRICNYVTISALVFMLYDIIINLQKEIPLVWVYRQDNDHAGPIHYFRRVKQVLVHLLFILSRYYGLVFLTTLFAVNNTTELSVTVYISFRELFARVLPIPISCKKYYYYHILAGTVLYVTIVNVILAMRINALYGRKRCWAIFLGSLVIGEFLVDISICVVMAVHSTDDVVSPPPWIPWRGCMISSRITPALTLASWLTALLVSTIFCVMTLKNILFNTHEDMLRLPPRTRVLLQDGVTLYFLMFLIVLASAVVLTVIQNELSAMPVSLLVAIYSYCASRLILNIIAVEDEHCPTDVPDDLDSHPSLAFLTLPQPEELPVASSSRL